MKMNCVDLLSCKQFDLQVMVVMLRCEFPGLLTWLIFP